MVALPNCDLWRSLIRRTLPPATCARSRAPRDRAARRAASARAGRELDRHDQRRHQPRRRAQQLQSAACVRFGRRRAERGRRSADLHAHEHLHHVDRRPRNGHLSALHRTQRAGLALESGRQLERSERSGVLDGGKRAAVASRHELVRLSFTGARLHARPRQRRRLLASDRRRPFVLLEERSVSRPGVHRRERYPAPAVDRRGSRRQKTRRRDSSELGRPVCDHVRRAVLDRRRRDRRSRERQLDDVRRRRHRVGKRRHGDDPTRLVAAARRVRPRADERVVGHL